MCCRQLGLQLSYLAAQLREGQSGCGRIRLSSYCRVKGLSQHLVEQAGGDVVSRSSRRSCLPRSN